MTLSSFLAACPNCAVGREARADFWSDSPEYYSGIVLLPFAVVLLVSRLASRHRARS